MLDEIKKLKEQYQNSTNDNELEEVRNKMKDLFQKDPDNFSESMVVCMKERNQEVDELLQKKAIDEALNDVEENNTYTFLEAMEILKKRHPKYF